MIIALDAASTDLSVALAEADGSLIADEAWSSAQRQSAELLPHLIALLERQDRSLHDARGIGVGIGPGSFTGLRVGLALGKGLAVGLGCPIVGVPSLRAWLDAAPDAVAAVTRAGAREAYLLARGEDDPRVVEQELVVRLVGDAVVVAPTELASAFGLAGARSPRGAAAIALAAAVRMRTGGDDVATLEPAYLRAPRGVAVTEGAWR